MCLPPAIKAEVEITLQDRSWGSSFFLAAGVALRRSAASVVPGPGALGAQKGGSRRKRTVKNYNVVFRQFKPWLHRPNLKLALSSDPIVLRATYFLVQQCPI